MILALAAALIEASEEVTSPTVLTIICLRLSLEMPSYFKRTDIPNDSRIFCTGSG